MKKILGMVGLSVAALLVGCGGGGGSAGDTQLRYSISLVAAKTQLPINIQGYPAGAGAYAPYTTTLYVSAREGSSAIPGSGETEVFGCRITQGLDSGALYYLDGNEDHQDDDGKPLPFRSVALASNAGGNSFHFHSGTQAGVARVQCSITDPRDNQVYSASVDITVGGATGMPASVIGLTQAPGYLGSLGNVGGLRNNVAIQASVMDDANQPIPNPAAPNVQISLLPRGAYQGARLLSGTQSGSVVQVSTTGGIGLFSLSSGPNAGTILLQLTADRYDNNVANGIQDPVESLLAVPVVDRDLSTVTPLAFDPPTITAVNGNSFSYALTATGGMPPYSWTALGSLPAGISFSGGVFSGTPNTAPGTYGVAVRVSDQANQTATENVTITITGDLPTSPLAMSITGCTTTDVNTACALPPATLGQPYLYALTATGGDASQAITWTVTGLPAASGLTAGSAGNTGTISGTPGGTTSPLNTAACGTHNFLVTAKRGDETVTRQVSITVSGGTCP
ncbi:MAG: Ig domain-containing protein [Pseudomonadota bacterium]|nr:Ig domain-containing protein [Pseudomonadota bacterium]